MRARHWRAQRHHHARRLSRPHVHHGQGGHQGPVRPGPTNVARQWAERGVLLQPDPPSAEGGPPWQQMERLTPLSPLALGRRHSSYNLPFLNHLEKYVARAARVAVPFNNYVTGSCAFTHKAGVHSKVGMVLLPCALVVHRCPLTPSPHLSPPPPARPSCRTLLRTKCSTRRTLACSAPLRYPCTGAKLRQPGQHLLPPPSPLCSSASLTSMLPPSDCAPPNRLERASRSCQGPQAHVERRCGSSGRRRLATALPAPPRSHPPLCLPLQRQQIKATTRLIKDIADERRISVEEVCT